MRMKLFHKLVCGILALSLLTNSAGPVLAFPPAAPPAQEATVEPASISLALDRGQPAKRTITVTTASTPIPKVDVLFLFDVTGSMGDVIDAAKSNGVFIMNTLKAKVPDSAFGVASFADYPDSYDYAGYARDYGAPGDYPWRLDIDISTDTAAVQMGIESLGLLDGKDGPEAYSRALFEALYDIAWRPGAKHIIILFGDAVPHDTDFFSSFGENYGVDPGVDEEAGTPDDLDFEDVVAQVKDRGIQIIPVNSDLGHYDTVQAGFEYMADQTGGDVYQLDDAEALPDVVAASLEEATSVISALTITPDPDYEGWVQVSPASYKDVGGGETRSFDVTITVPADATAGQHTFNLTAAGDYATLGSTTVNVTVGAVALDPAGIKAKKYALIQELSEPSFETEFLKARFTWTPKPENSYAADEEVVKAWLDGLDWNALTPPELGAVHSLTVQEEALAELMHAQAKTSHIGNSQVGHVVGLVFSVVSAVKFLDSLKGKHIVGRLVSKLQTYVYAKLAHLTATMIVWATSQLPPDPKLERFRAQVNAIGELFQESLENALKKKSIKGEFLKQLLADAIVYPMDKVANKIYVERTADLVSQGLSTAQQRSQMLRSLDEVESQAAQIEGQVSVEAAAAQSEAQRIEVVAKGVEETQNSLSAISDAASTVSTLMTLTGLGALPAQVGHLVSLALKAVDGVMSVSLGYRAYSAWWSTPDAATNVTTLAFATGPIPPPLISIDRPPTLAGRDALVCAVTTDASLAPALSDHARDLLSRLHSEVVVYESLLDRLADAVRAGDASSAETVLDELLAADANLTSAFLIARQPIFAAAHEALNRGTPGFETAYSDFGRGAAAFDGEGAKLYVYLLGWFFDPSNPENQQLLLDQIEATKKGTERYQAGVTGALPYTKDVEALPSVLVSDHTLPDLKVGQEAVLQVEVTNPAPDAATGVTVTFDPGENARAVGKTTFSLDSVPGGGTSTLQIPFVPGGEGGFFSLSTSASNGSGSFVIIPFTAEGGGNGGSLLGLICILLLVVVSGATAVGIAQRRHPGGLRLPWPTRAQLHGLRGEWAGRSIAIPRGGLTIGRGTGNSVQLSNPAVSRQHAIIRRARGQYFVQDRGSQHGTYVNGQRIDAIQLNAGDRITIGDTEFEFRMR